MLYDWMLPPGTDDDIQDEIVEPVEQPLLDQPSPAPAPTPIEQMNMPEYEEPIATMVDMPPANILLSDCRDIVLFDPTQEPRDGPMEEDTQQEDTDPPPTPPALVSNYRASRVSRRASRIRQQPRKVIAKMKSISAMGCCGKKSSVMGSLVEDVVI
mmetsp:Transcript_17641/g.31900  ORF Transcript_17641/g.31900 Transcript_17641/m.31900 type:complete len:156 (-) Transcript_17641:104-571(-)|eukprot:CAMPEP_0201599686 /NCGR_PEP_ID=MMETSP0492-20130828/1046_1 /ASSEMBLY_ACC=CAM_ASM_000837 /TAXON_ID=420259 /ORGANISM="Thalassiosira gravida, Strain GMp14c1" /LENGTH=155 /DNA_ID=CAMNT_0048062313 /DNA_START=14 /DNA_END=481 /DNA_ORIENTATION=+